MAYNYVVTAQKPTIVTQSVTGAFTSPDAINVILGKFSRLEIHLMTEDGLEPVLDVPLFGKISSLSLYRPAEESKQDYLFICTERQKFCVLRYDMESQKLVTVANGDLTDKGRPAERQMCSVDPYGRMIGCQLYSGLFQVLPMQRDGSLHEQAFNLRIDELRIEDTCFIRASNQLPTLAVLYQDPKEKRHLKTYLVDLEGKELVPGPISAVVSNTASCLVPIDHPFQGVMVVANDCVTYHSENTHITAPLHNVAMLSYGKVDQYRFLLGDIVGNLYVAVLKHDGTKVVDISTERLGLTTPASTISYLDNGYVFIGSAHGDSEMIKLNATKDEDGSYIAVEERYATLGPIVDMEFIDLDRQGQGQLVTCSGTFSHGSIRVVRNGISINENAAVDMPGMKGIWSLRPSSESAYDRYLVETFVGDTRVLEMNDEGELVEVELPGIAGDAQTLHCSNMANDTYVQVTPSAVRIVSCESNAKLGEWNPPSGQRITLAHSNQHMVLLSTGAGRLVLLRLNGYTFEQLAATTLEHEVACVDISPLEEGKDDAPIAAVGMWTDISVRLLQVPSLKQVHTEPLGGEIIPRSVKLVPFDNVPYLLCGLGDGSLFTLELSLSQDAASVKSRKKVTLGTQPIVLTAFKQPMETEDESMGDSADQLYTTQVFACCDRPAIIYPNNGRLLFSNVNMADVNHMSPFHSKAFENCLAFATDTDFIIGDIDDEIQKLQVQTVDLGEQPSKLCHQADTKSILVLTSSLDASGRETNYMRLLDSQTYERIDSFQLDDVEYGSAVISMRFAQSDVADMEVDEGESKSTSELTAAEYYVVGTAYAPHDKPEPIKGRLLVFRVTKPDRKLDLVAEHIVKGAVYATANLNGLLVATVNSSVIVFGLKESTEATHSHTLTEKAKHHGHVLSLYCKTRGDFVIVGDLMRSVSVLIYKANTRALEEVAKDFEPAWTTALEFMDEKNYICADSSYNVYTVMRNTDAVEEEQRARLVVQARYHLADFVNVIKPGSLVMKLPDSTGLEPSLLIGTVGGAILVVARLSEDQYMKFKTIEDILAETIEPVGKLTHADFRRFTNERTSHDRKGFIDGDLIESFLDLDPQVQAKVAAKAGMALSEVLLLVEDASRVH